MSSKWSYHRVDTEVFSKQLDCAWSKFFIFTSIRFETPPLELGTRQHRRGCNESPVINVSYSNIAQNECNLDTLNIPCFIMVSANNIHELKHIYIVYNHLLLTQWTTSLKRLNRRLLSSCLLEILRTLFTSFTHPLFQN